MAGRPPFRGSVRAAALAAARVWPTMFGYQFVFEAVVEESSRQSTVDSRQ
jgi:hypothetical protein